MSDRLAEIKNLIAHVKVSEHQYEADRLDQVKAVQAIVWTVAKIEQLQARNKELNHWLSSDEKERFEKVKQLQAEVEEVQASIGVEKVLSFATAFKEAAKMGRAKAEHLDDGGSNCEIEAQQWLLQEFADELEAKAKEVEK